MAYWVAERDGQVVGIGGHDHERVHTLFVRPDCQGLGIGSRLLSTVSDHARAESIAELRVWSTAYAVPFYERHGFRFVRDLWLPRGCADIGLIEMVLTL